MSVTVKIDEDVLLEMLMDRYIKWWDESGKNADLYEQMYQNYIENGAFDGMELDISIIVDNDVVNYCKVVEKGDKDFDKLLELSEQGEYDVSTEEFEEISPSFIEAVSDDKDRILVRY